MADDEKKYLPRDYDPLDTANYEIEERAAILQLNNPVSRFKHPLHLLNTAKKQVRERDAAQVAIAATSGQESDGQQ
jgi:hypothetical protein